MGRRVRIVAEATDFDYTARFHALVGEDRKARTLQDYQEQFGGSLEGEVSDPFGNKHRVSLAAFGDLPPETFVRVRFAVAKEGIAFAPVHGDAVVLKEYVLPEGTKVFGE